MEKKIDFEEFKIWLSQILKCKTFDCDWYLEELKDTFEITKMNEFVIPKELTESGKEEIFVF